ncbi:MAG: flagellar export chaperone FliS [Ruminococcus sp.]|jgi:flagellar protein FliS|nr:flagellar export chaperone FliS [Ruminococcus sp.]MBQ7008194.1 flagellar export chaperone FliS [Ruminococcus sp.]MBR4023394.1 flagellar export chaperone FliS [Ruminococcus sp.]
MPVNPYKKYQEQSIATMTQGELLNVLYETCYKRINTAIIAIEEKKYDVANQNVQKAKNIIRHLDETLDKNYEISESLASLYDFFIYQLTTANVKKNTEMLREVAEMIDELGKTFKEADKIARKKRA